VTDSDRPLPGEGPSPRPLTRLLGALSRPRARLWLLLALLLLVGLPALVGGFALDDLLIYGHLSAGGSPFSAFALGPQSASEVAAWRDSGLYPWWASDALQVDFFRPLSALTHALDQALWPQDPRLMHLHSIAWYLLLLVGVGALYRRLDASCPENNVNSGWIHLAGLALVLYAIDDAHAINVAWLAARNSLVGAMFGVLALLALVRRRIDGWRLGALLGPIFAGLGLLAAEATLAAFGYLLAFSLTLDPSPRWRTRARSLLPYALVLVAWVVLYRTLGHGAAGCGLYSDPFADPLAFVGAALSRGALLIAAQLGLPMVIDLIAYIPGIEAQATGAALLGVAITTAVLWPTLRRSRLARFFALGMLFAALAHGMTVPQERYLLLIGVGGCGLVACVLVELARGALCSRTARALAWIWLLLHVALPPLLALPRTLGVASLHGAIEAGADALDAQDQTVILLNAPGDVFALYAPLLRDAAGSSEPGMVLLYAGSSALEIARDDAATLRLSAEQGWLAAPGDRLLRDSAHPLELGEVVVLQGPQLVIEVEVVRLTADGRPQSIELRLATALDDPSLRWMVWEDGAPRPWTPPSIGDAQPLQPASWVFAPE